jgi:glycerophosphoryl diester phosphodiesterase
MGRSGGSQKGTRFCGRLLGGLALLAALSCWPAERFRGPERVQPPDGVLIAHALGGIEGTTYSNSKEAFEHSWRLGFRWFEVDLSTTADSVLVCFHERYESHIGLDVPVSEVTAARFLKSTYDGRFSPLTFEDLLRMLAGRPGAVLVTDTKELSADVMERLDAAIRRVDPALRAQIVVQIYRPEDLELVRTSERRHGAFGGVIFTLYQIDISNDEVLDFVDRSGLWLITASKRRFDSGLARALHGRGARIFVHTLNDPERMRKLTAEGANGFYTDFVAPSGSPGAASLPERPTQRVAIWYSRSFMPGVRPSAGGWTSSRASWK